MGHAPAEPLEAVSASQKPEEERPEEPEPSFTGVAGKSSPRGLHWDEEDEQGLSAESTRSFELWTVPASVQCVDDDLRSRHSYESWTVPTTTEIDAPSNRLLHEAYRKEVHSFIAGVRKDPIAFKRLIGKSRGELDEATRSFWDSLCEGRRARGFFDWLRRR
ncbi:unnamed protein product [Durusdinium trenchii]|uniref:Uncharacterized protein n=2 Tax=Durusdinium trenchii TaxID=1381693 RepID=A0ABP0MVP4_9DINO